MSDIQILKDGITLIIGIALFTVCFLSVLLKEKKSKLFMKVTAALSTYLCIMSAIYLGRTSTWFWFRFNLSLGIVELWMFIYLALGFVLVIYQFLCSLGVIEPVKEDQPASNELTLDLDELSSEGKT